MSQEKEAKVDAKAMTDAQLDAHLAELRDRKAKSEEQRESERVRRAKELEAEELELEAKYETELGPRGVKFEIVRTPIDGCIVVKRGPSVLYKQFTHAVTKTDGNPSPEAVHAYVAPCVVHPEKSAFNKIAEERPLVALRCANALTDLHGAKAKEEQGKY